MIKVSVFYPAGENKKFDMDYYCKSHMPMVQQKLGAACKSMAVEQGLGGGAPGAPATYAAMGHLYFDSAGGVRDGIRIARGGDHGGYPELHQHPAGDPDQRSQDVTGSHNGEPRPVIGAARGVAIRPARARTSPARPRRSPLS